MDYLSIVFRVNHIARGMYYLSSEGIVHCDLATRNILVSPSQDSNPFNQYSVKITDFGLAKDSTAAKGDSPLPSTHQSMFFNIFN